MKKYLVKIDFEGSATFSIWANNEESAEEKAREKLNEFNGTEYELDEKDCTVEEE